MERGGESYAHTLTKDLHMLSDMYYMINCISEYYALPNQNFFLTYICILRQADLKSLLSSDDWRHQRLLNILRTGGPLIFYVFYKMHRNLRIQHLERMFQHYP